MKSCAPQAAELEEEASAQYERAAAAEEEAGAAEARSYAAAKQLEELQAQLQVLGFLWCSAFRQSTRNHVYQVEVDAAMLCCCLSLWRMEW
jgi:hypothetical protein